MSLFRLLARAQFSKGSGDSRQSGCTALFFERMGPSRLARLAGAFFLNWGLYISAIFRLLVA